MENHASRGQNLTDEWSGTRVPYWSCPSCNSTFFTLNGLCAYCKAPKAIDDYVDLTGEGIRESRWSGDIDGQPVSFSYYPDIDRFSDIRAVDMDDMSKSDELVPLDLDSGAADALFPDSMQEDSCTTTEEYDVYFHDNTPSWYHSDDEDDGKGMFVKNEITQ